MRDQKENLDKIGIMNSSYISSDLNGEQKTVKIEEFSNLKYQILWVSPERFQS